MIGNFTKAELKKHFDLRKPQVVKIPRDNRKLLLYWAKNCEKLAALMEEVERHDVESKHVQGDWGSIGPCGTSACALGHAALYNIIPGLQWTVGYWFDQTPDTIEINISRYMNRNPSDSALSITPVVNGEMVHWERAADRFFGYQAYFQIFRYPHLSTSEVIERLLWLSKHYKEGAKNS